MAILYRCPYEAAHVNRLWEDGYKIENFLGSPALIPRIETEMFNAQRVQELSRAAITDQVRVDFLQKNKKIFL